MISSPISDLVASMVLMSNQDEALNAEQATVLVAVAGAIDRQGGRCPSSGLPLHPDTTVGIFLLDSRHPICLAFHREAVTQADHPLLPHLTAGTPVDSDAYRDACREFGVFFVPVYEWMQRLHMAAELRSILNEANNGDNR